jgi:lipopolysaccharide export system permease protein
MKILHKYVMREILAPFVLALVVLSFLALVGDLLQELAERFTNKGLELSDLGMIVLYVIPVMAPYTVPIALLFATLAAYIQLSQDCEVIAMKAAGMPIRTIFAPAILIGAAAAVVLLPISVEISPWARRELKVFIINTVLEKPTLMLKEQAWTPEINGMRIFVGEINEKDMTLKDVTVMVNEEDKPNRTIVAETGRIEVDDEAGKIFLQLNDGSIHEFDPDSPDEYSTITFGSLKVPVNIGSIEKYIEYSKRYANRGTNRKKEMSLGRLTRGISAQAAGSTERRDLIAQIGKRTALAFMPLALVLIGAPMGIIPYRSRRFYGLAVCGLLLLTYYALLMMSESLSENDIVHPLFAMWIPNILLGLAGVAFMSRAERH